MFIWPKGVIFGASEKTAYQIRLIARKSLIFFCRLMKNKLSTYQQVVTETHYIK